MKRLFTRRSLVPLLLATGLTTGCAASPSTTPAVTGDAGRTPTAGSARPSESALPSGLPELRDGAIGPARFVLLPPPGGWGECVMGPKCAPEPPHARTLRLEITVPDGWKAMEGFGGSVIVPQGDVAAGAPDGAASVIGWSNRAGLHSDPCLPVAHMTPDIVVGPTVEDFVDAIQAHPLLTVNEPEDAELDGFRGRLLTLTAPMDISGCDNWRPWEPGIFAQGPGNIWNLWIIDVDGLRMVLLASEFPGTSEATRAALRGMVESVRFIP